LSLTPFSEKLISFLIIDELILTGILGFVSLGAPQASAESVELFHDAGNLDFYVDEHAAFPFAMSYLGVQQSDKIGGWKDETFFFFDQSQYYHSGSGDIATGRKALPGGQPAEFTPTSSDYKLSLLEDGIVDKSFGSFTKTKDIQGQKNDVRIVQNAWSRQGEDWGIIQWTAQNLYETDLSEVRFGLRFYSAVGGDNGDDKANWDPNEKVYYISDSGSSHCLGFASADSGIPLNLYWDGNINDMGRDSDIYTAIKSSPYISGFYNDLGCVVGWTDDEGSNNGMTLPAKKSLTRALIVVMGTSYNDVLLEIERARKFYLPRTLKINEISDEGVPKVEIKATSTQSVDLSNYGLSVDGGKTYWNEGSWDVNPIPGGGFSVWTLSGNDSFNAMEGANLGLHNTTSNFTMDEVSFGQMGIAPDPINDPQIGSISRVCDTQWIHSLKGTSFGGDNNDNVSINLDPQVVLNEVMFNPRKPEFGFIELMYTGSSEMDIQGFSIISNTRAQIQSSQILKFDDPYFTIFRNDAPSLFDTLSKSTDNIYLYDDLGNLLDMVGWNNTYEKNATIKRSPEGYGTHFGFNDPTSISAGWIFNSQPTIPLVLVGPNGQFEYVDSGDEIWFNLTLTNKLTTPELYDIQIQSLQNWQLDVYDKSRMNQIGDSNGNGEPDILIQAQSQKNISLKVSVPESEIFGDYQNILITAIANSNSAIRHTTFVQARFNPYILPKKSVEPSQIYINGTGYSEEATITLEIIGSGFGVPTYKPQDIVFCVDRSNSMLPSDIDLAKQAISEFTDNMSTPDRGSVVHFDSEVVLMNSLTSNYIKLQKDIENIPGPGQLTYMGEALLEALMELNGNGKSDKAHIIILLTDGGWNGELDPITVAKWARENGTLIFTIGLGDGGYNLILKEIADITGAENFTAETIDEFRAVYDEIAFYLDKTAGYDPSPEDSNPMIRDVLPPGINLVPGSFSHPPDHVYVNASGYTIMEWNISLIFIGESWKTSFNITSSNLGFQEANNYTHSRINYTHWADLEVERLFPKTMIFVKIPTPLPPILSIDVVDEFGNLRGIRESIRLRWIGPSSPNIAYYLIYRSDEQNNFDFQTPWIQTDIHSDNGIVPLRTTWNDTFVNKPQNGNYKQQKYYIIRAVNEAGMVSYTSRTVGKWTKEFLQGVSTFSLPLKPIQTNNVGWYANDMRADHIKWMDSNQQWIRFIPDEEITMGPDVLVGEGYEVSFSNPTIYTFSGLPSTMIRYRESIMGFNPNFASYEAQSLDAKVDRKGSVNLSWTQPQNMNSEHRFYVLRSENQDGFWGALNQDFIIISDLSYNVTNYQDQFISTQDTQFYYMVVLINATSGEWGSSCYSIGVFTKGLNRGYDTLGLPSKLKVNQYVDWYCENTQYVLGMNYFLPAEQRWIWHRRNMPEGVYDTEVVLADAYQISTVSSSKLSFVGI
jgi:hypothetical protein